MTGIGEGIGFSALSLSACFCLYVGQEALALWLFAFVAAWAVFTDWGEKKEKSQ